MLPQLDWGQVVESPAWLMSSMRRFGAHWVRCRFVVIGVSVFSLLCTHQLMDPSARFAKVMWSRHSIVRTPPILIESSSGVAAARECQERGTSPGLWFETPAVQPWTLPKRALSASIRKRFEGEARVSVVVLLAKRWFSRQSLEKCLNICVLSRHS